MNRNYNFADIFLTKISKILALKFFKKESLKIGVFGAAIRLENLVDKKYTEEIILERAGFTRELSPGDFNSGRKVLGPDLSITFGLYL